VAPLPVAQSPGTLACRPLRVGVGRLVVPRARRPVEPLRVARARVAPPHRVGRPVVPLPVVPLPVAQALAGRAAP